MRTWKTTAAGVLAAGLATAAAPTARALTEFARGELDLAATAALTYDSRVLGGATPGDDYILSLQPQLLYRREAALVKVDGAAGVTFNRYADLTRYDSEDVDSHVKFTLPKDAVSRGSGSLALSYLEKTDVNFDVNERLRSKVFDSRLDALFPVGLKTAVSLLGAYNHAERQTFGTLETREGGAGFTYADFLRGTDLNLQYRRLETESAGATSLSSLDQQSDSYSVGLSRPIFHKIKGSISYGYRMLRRGAGETVNGQRNSNGSIFSAAIEGPFLPATKFPKLESSLSVSYSQADSPGINDTGGHRVVGKASLSWAARDTTRISVTAQRGFELAVNNLTVLSTDLTAQVTQEVGHFTELTGGGGYERRTYHGLARYDDVLTAFVAANYRATRFWRLTMDARVRDTDSTDVISAYARTVVRASATFTY